MTQGDDSVLVAMWTNCRHPGRVKEAALLYYKCQRISIISTTGKYIQSTLICAFYHGCYFVLRLFNRILGFIWGIWIFILCMSYVEPAEIYAACIFLYRLHPMQYGPWIYNDININTIVVTACIRDGSRYYIEAETKWPPFSSRYFQMHLLE